MTPGPKKDSTLREPVKTQLGVEFFVRWDPGSALWEPSILMPLPSGSHPYRFGLCRCETEEDAWRAIDEMLTPPRTH